MVELDSTTLQVFAGMIAAAQVPTWTLLFWVIRKQADLCERVAGTEKENSIYHKQPIQP